MRVFVVLVALTAGCGASRSTWLLEVNRLAAQPLACEQFDVVTMHHDAHEYDSVGCGLAIRYICRDGACAPSGGVVTDGNPGMARLTDRASHTRAVLSRAAPVLTRECSNGGTFAARLFIDKHGFLSDVQTNPNRNGCIYRNVPRLPGGSGSMVIAVVFTGYSATEE